MVWYVKQTAKDYDLMNLLTRARNETARIWYETAVERDNLPTPAERVAAASAGTFPYEVWLPVLTWEDSHLVSNFGKVKGLPRGGASERILGVTYSRFGYPRVSLSCDGRTEQRLVHQLVCEAFHGPRPLGMQVRHYPDFDPANVRADNLSWGTREDDAHDRQVNYWRQNPVCPEGHAYDDYAYFRTDGSRRCPLCLPQAVEYPIESNLARVA